MKILNKNVNLDDFFKSVQTDSLLMLDYDGTLSPFVEERMLATPYPGVKDRLLQLNQLKNNRTVIISGRSLADLEVLLDMLPGFELWGSHGLERKRASGEKINAHVGPKIMEGLKKGEEACLEKVAEEHCEIKPYGVAVHWRGMDPKEKQKIIESIEDLWKKISSSYDLEIHHFDGGLELRPKARNKGDVIRELLKEVRKDTAIAYLGDDLTDENAFAALADRGLKALVRKEYRQTLADIHLIPPEELLAFLDRWILSKKETLHE